MLHYFIWFKWIGIQCDLHIGPNSTVVFLELFTSQEIVSYYHTLELSFKVLKCDGTCPEHRHLLIIVIHGMAADPLPPQQDIAHAELTLCGKSYHRCLS